MFSWTTMYIMSVKNPQVTRSPARTLYVGLHLQGYLELSIRPADQGESTQMRPQFGVCAP